MVLHIEFLEDILNEEQIYFLLRRPDVRRYGLDAHTMVFDERLNHVGHLKRDVRSLGSIDSNGEEHTLDFRNIENRTRHKPLFIFRDHRTVEAINDDSSGRDENRLNPSRSLNRKAEKS